MTSDDADATALELARRFGSAGSTPVDALEACLARIDALNPVLNAVVVLDADGAREAAQGSARRWRRGGALSPLDGVPILVKDNLHVRGLRATWGSHLYEDFVPDCDELPVARLRAAGLVIVGKTNVPEFTLQGYTDNLLFGCTLNPWQPALTAGGSSGGAVTAVASGMSPLALATDGGGSIRRPVSYCGLLGHKPTAGRAARAGGFPAIMHDFEVVGPIARSLADLDALMTILSRPDPADPASLQWPTWRPVAGEEGAPALSVRIAYMPTFGGAPVDPEIAASVAAAAGELRSLGHTVMEIECPFDLAGLGEAFGAVSASGLAWLLRGDDREIARCGPEMRAMAEQGAHVSGADYAAALATVAELKRGLGRLFQTHDVILTPAAAAMPWPAGQSHPAEIAGVPVGPRGHAVFTSFANMGGCPALAIPCSPASSGLPIGFQIVAAPGGDEVLFGLAYEYLQHVSWAFRSPVHGPMEPPIANSS